MTIKKPSFLLLFFIIFSLQVANAEVYRWKDKNGNIHFSDKPTADATQLDVNAPKPSGIGVSKKQSQRTKELLEQFEEKNIKNKQIAQKKKQNRDALEKYCSRLKNRLRNYEEADYLFKRNKTGEKIDLSDKRKQAEETKLRKEISERCQ